MSKHKQKKPSSKTLCGVNDENAPFNYVEAYKMLCTNIEFISATQKCKSLMITSTLADEGKTNVAVNLALTLSGYGKKVCLVECDLRRPTIHRYLYTKRNTQGLTNVLKKQTELLKAIHNVSDTNMSILLAGTIPPNPSELLASESMKTLVSELESMYDYVIYDTPPVLLVTDAAALGRYVDGCIFVIKHDTDDKGIVVKAKKNLDAAGVKILGAVYTNYSEKTASAYSSYYKYGYYKNYYYYNSNYSYTNNSEDHDK